MYFLRQIQTDKSVRVACGVFLSNEMSWVCVCIQWDVFGYKIKRGEEWSGSLMLFPCRLSVGWSLFTSAVMAVSHQWDTYELALPPLFSDYLRMKQFCKQCCKSSLCIVLCVVSFSFTCISIHSFIIRCFGIWGEDPAVAVYWHPGHLESWTQAGRGRSFSATRAKYKLTA